MKVFLDSLVDYVTLNTEVTKEELNKRLEKYQPRIEATIKAALDEAKLAVNDVDDVELIGSGLRVPAIKDMISDVLKGAKISQMLNQEEAMSFGTGFLAASLSHSFKVKPITIVHTTAYDLSIDMENIYSENCTETQKLQCNHKPFSYKNTLIKKRSNYDIAKSVTFPHASDLSITLYEHVGSNPRKLMTYTIVGINEVAAKFNTIPKLALRFEVNTYGMVDLVSAKALVEQLVKKNATNSSEPGNETVEKVEEKFDLKVTREQAYPLSMSSQDLDAARRRLDELDDQEAQVMLRTKAKNSYEGLIYSTRDWLNDDLNAPYIPPKVKDMLMAYLAEEEEWLYASDRNGVTKEEYEKRTKDLEDKTKDMKVSKKEFEMFKPYVESLNTFIKNTTQALTLMKKDKTWISEEQYAPTYAKIKELEEWIQLKVKERSEKPPTSEPVLTQALVTARMSTIRALLKALNTIEKPKPEPAKDNKTENSTEQSSDSTNSSKLSETHNQSQTLNKTDDPNQIKIEDL